jgi:hypothetical protein
VQLVARSHWLVGGVIVAAIALVHLITRDLPIAFSPRAYQLTGGLAALFLLTGTLVWFGVAPGQLVSRICAFFYLIRPGLCFRLLEAMRHPEFVAHFRRGGAAQTQAHETSPSDGPR